MDLVTRDEKNQKRAILFSALERNEYQQPLIKAAYAVFLNQSHLAIDLLKPLADAAIPEAMCMLGAVYQAGAGINTDAELALNYLLQALEAGNGVAAHNLFNLYHKGIEGIPANEETCLYYLGQARQMGMYHS
ncbi:hypothetical protein ACO0LF_14925 [Undibacterium sp. Di27W]|uniref:hypothetical protein n=1 Tax=Undibacterium sp. Di27W TaxID=3413036 RepID=UPI003BF09DBE